MLHKLIYDTAANCDTRRPSLTRGTGAFEFDGAVPASSTIAMNDGIQVTHRTVITLNDLAVSLSDTNVGGGSLIFTFPQGIIRYIGGIAKAITPTTTSTLASTLNASKTLSVGVGTVQTVSQASGTLTTTEQDLINAFSATSSATVNVAGTGGTGISAVAGVLIDGHTTAGTAYLNFGVPTATDIDGDATITVDGEVTLIWQYLGDY